MIFNFVWSGKDKIKRLVNHDMIATKQDVLNVIIWNNQNLLINKKSIYNKRIKEAGFMKLGDILSANDSKLKNGMLLERKISPCQIIYSYKAFFPPFPLTGNCSLRDGEMERIITTELTKLFQTMLLKI